MMKKVITCIVVLALLINSSIFTHEFSVDVHAAQNSYYVDPVNGSDDNQGSLTNPFKSIEKARDIVRTVNSSMTGDIDVYLMPGDYFLDSTLSFDERDSGSNGFSVVYRNYGDPASARILGGKEISGWQQHSGNIYKAQIGASVDFDTLFENGIRSTLARHPNTGYIRTASTGSSSKSSFSYKSGDFPVIADSSDLQVNVWPTYDWYNQTVGISGIDTSTNTVTTSENTLFNISGNNRYFIQGAIELLDTPGEFYLDKSTGWLYYWPVTAPIENQRIVIPQIRTIVSVVGSSETESAHNIGFEGLTIGMANSLYELGYGGTDSNVYLENADNISIEHCRIVNGHMGIAMLNYAQNNRVYGNEIAYIGNHGVLCRGTGPDLSYENKGNIISNNHIHDVGQYNGTASGVSIKMSGDNEISYNEINNSPRGGIILGSKKYSRMASAYDGVNVTWENHWDFSHPRNNVIKFNDVYNVMLDSGDGGAIYTCGTGKGNVIDNNRVHDITEQGLGRVRAIYLDDDTSYTTVTNNIVYNIFGQYHSNPSHRSNPVMLKGVYNVFSNNIIADNGTHISTEVRVVEYDNCDTDTLEMTNNIFAKNPGTNIYSFGSWEENMVAKSDYNLIYHTGGTYGMYNIPGNDTYSNWRATSSYVLDLSGGTVTVDETPGVGNKSMKLVDSSATSGVSAKKLFRIQEDKVSLEIRLQAEQIDGEFGVTLANRADTVAVYVGLGDNGQFFHETSGGATDIQAYNTNQWYTVRVELDPVLQTYDIYVDDVKVVSQQTFLNAVGVLEKIELATKDGTGTTYMDYVEIFNDQKELLYDGFDDDPTGGAPSVFDINSVTADPMFVDAANHDYTVQPSSPALNLGFVNINQTDIGVKSDYLYVNYTDPVPEPEPETTTATFFDGFENGFGQWSVVSGTPSVSTVKTYNGSYSYICDEDKDAITYNAGQEMNNSVITLMYYDDTSAGWIDNRVKVSNDSLYTLVGVRNNNSSNKYVFNNNGVWNVTNIDRKTGWHEFKWDFTDGSDCKIYIDGVLISTVNAFDGFDTLQIGDNSTGGDEGYIYYDDIQVESYGFEDGFEDGFDNWTVLQGNASVSSIKTHSGSYSYYCDEDKDQIQYESSTELTDKVITLWFYDDTSATWLDNRVSVANDTVNSLMGVRYNNSSSKYIYKDNSTWHVTNITRTTGWHELKWDFSDGTDCKLYIDGIQIGTIADFDGFKTIKIGDNSTGGDTGYIYYDDVTIE